jgi:UDP-N-acetylglucosamine 1-carboxyvinyltransferase
MHKFEIEGGGVLSGTVSASGSKNSALPILFASILNPHPVELKRVPVLKDIETTLTLLRGVGADIERVGDSAKVSLKKLSSTEAPYELVRTMRASILMLGPILAREGVARVSLPGGCAIGSRPVDLHLSGLEKMGAELTLEHGYVNAKCAGGLRGAVIEFRMPSVGATEHLMMAATLAKGETVLKNAAREPEIADLANFLNSMGAKVSGAGGSEIRIQGGTSFRATKYEVMFDRIEAGTLLLAGPITGGKVRVEKTNAADLGSYLDILRDCGVTVSVGKDFVEAQAGNHPCGVSVTTEPYPGFPTDLQAQLMAYLAQVDGESEITESIFENRFMHVPELNRLGANIRAEGAKAKIMGKHGCYSGATVMATDLRASASLVLAGLSGRGTTTVRRIYHLDRGYEEMEKKLAQLGARISRSQE